MATSLKALNALLAKLKLPNAQDLIGRKYSFSAGKNKLVGFQIEVGVIGRVVYDVENATLQIIPLCYSRESFSTLQIEITVDTEHEASFGYAQRMFRTTDNLAVEDNSHDAVPGVFRVLK